MFDSIKFKGSIYIKHFDADGNLKEEREMHNLIVNAGLALMAALVDGSVTTPIVGMAIGTGTTAAAVTDTALQTEVMRGATTNSIVTTTVANDTAEFSYTFAITATYAITEEGLFTSSAASSGTMLSHQVFAALNLVATDSIQIIHKIQSQA